MKLLYILEDISIKGGAERIVIEKANWFSQHGHEVYIVSVYEDHRPVAYPVADGVRVVRLNVPFPIKSNVLLRQWSRLSAMRKAISRFNDIVKEIQPDVLFGIWILGALLLSTAKVKAKKIYESHSPRHCTPHSSIINKMVRIADAVVCLTQGDAEEFTDAKRVTVIPNYSTITLCESDTGTNPVDYNSRHVIAVGRLEEVKNFSDLIIAWSYLSDNHSNWVLDIYGEGPLHEALNRQITALKLNSSVILHGRTDDMQSVYRRASIHVMTSKHEGLPMTMIEAQTLGIPSVSYDFKHGARDIIKNNVNGIIVKENTPTELANALDLLMSDAEFRSRMGTEAQKLATRFNRETIMESWQTLLSSLY